MGLKHDQLQMWTLINNPAWAGRTPDDGFVPFRSSACHDRSHFITVACSCGQQMHVHETQIAGTEEAGIASPCKGCGDLLLFDPGALQSAFAELRQQGWIR